MVQRREARRHLPDQLPVDAEELEHHLPAEAKRYIAKNDIKLYTINAIDLASEIGMGKRTNTILQSAFFTLAKVIPAEEAIQYMKDAATKSYLQEGPGRRRHEPQAPSTRGATAFVQGRRARRLGRTPWTTQPVERDSSGRPELVKMVTRASWSPSTAWTATACLSPPS